MEIVDVVGVVLGIIIAPKMKVRCQIPETEKVGSVRYQKRTLLCSQAPEVVVDGGLGVVDVEGDGDVAYLVRFDGDSVSTHTVEGILLGAVALGGFDVDCERGLLSLVNRQDRNVERLLTCAGGQRDRAAESQRDGLRSTRGIHDGGTIGVDADGGRAAERRIVALHLHSVEAEVGGLVVGDGDGQHGRHVVEFQVGSVGAISRHGTYDALLHRSGAGVDGRLSVALRRRHFDVQRAVTDGGDIAAGVAGRVGRTLGDVENGGSGGALLAAGHHKGVVCGVFATALDFHRVAMLPAAVDTIDIDLGVADRLVDDDGGEVDKMLLVFLASTEKSSSSQRYHT